jgi:chromosome segregation ATPase
MIEKGTSAPSQPVVNGAGSFDAATRRLVSALDALEAAVERRKDADRSEARLAEQLQALGTDRSNLAAELDGMSARARRLEEANSDAAQRIDSAMETIRAVLEPPAGET